MMGDICNNVNNNNKRIIIKIQRNRKQMDKQKLTWLTQNKLTLDQAGRGGSN